MTLPNPIANNSTEAYLAYKAGVLEVGDLKPSLYSPYLHFDAWLAYWCGLTDTYPLDDDNQPEMLTDEEALVAYLSGATNTYPEEMRNPNDVRIVGYLRYLVSVKYGRPETPLNNSELYLSMVHPSTISNITPSSDFVLDGTAEYPLLDLKLYGDTFQQTYSGKNIVQIIGTNSNGIISSEVDGEMYISGQATDNWAFVVQETSTDIAAGEYTASINITLSHSVDIRLYFEDNTNDTYAIGAGNTSRTFTTTKRAVKYAVLFGGLTNGQQYDEHIELQLEAGGTPTPFEPFTGRVSVPNPSWDESISVVGGEQSVTVTGDGEESEVYAVDLGAIELCKIGEYQDYIYKSGDDWYVHKAIQKLVANGSEPWSKGTNAGLVYLSSTGSVAGSADNNPVISTDYTARFAIEDNSVFLQTVKGRLAVIDTVNATTSDAWKTYLSGHNVTFYYALETPTDTKITDSTLVDQLEAIVAGGSYDGTTHVVVTASGENLPALLLVIVAKG